MLVSLGFRVGETGIRIRFGDVVPRAGGGLAGEEGKGVGAHEAPAVRLGVFLQDQAVKLGEEKNFFFYSGERSLPREGVNLKLTAVSSSSSAAWNSMVSGSERFLFQRWLLSSTTDQKDRSFLMCNV